MRFFIPRSVILALCILSICGHANKISAAAYPPSEMSIQEIRAMKNVDKVLFLMQKRLAVMHEVARWKWNNKAPIEDLPREAQILENMAATAEAFAINKSWAINFFQAQMDAAKMIQRRDFDRWEEERRPAFEKIADLTSEIRPYLDLVTAELMAAIAEAAPDLENSSLISPYPLSSRPCDYLDEDVWAKATDPLCKPSP